MKYSVVIAELKEEDLQNTVDNIRATQCNLGEIIVISDKERKGPMRCRHDGIKQAVNDIVIIVDAHMRFSPRSLDTLARETAENQVNCAKCYHNSKILLSGNLYAGADLFDKYLQNGQYTAISSKWSEGKANSVMGACYCFHKTFYEKMGDPWQYGKGWGCDEEIISVLAWLLGGSVNVIDVKVAHKARNQAQVPYKLTREQVTGVWYNRIAMYHILPLTDTERKDYTNWIYKNKGAAINKSRINKLLKSEEGVLSHIKEQIKKNQVVKWQEFKKRIINKEVKEMKLSEIRAKCTLVGITLPFGVTKERALELYNTTRPKEKKEQNFRLPVVEDFGVRCPHCGKNGKPKVTTTYPNGNRRVVCCWCAKPFVTKAVF